MTDKDIFTSDNDGNVVNESGTQVTLTDQLSELIGPGKKYATAQDALNAVPHAQSHINKVEQDNASLRDKVEKASTVDDILNSINRQDPEDRDQTPLDAGTIAEQAAGLIRQDAQDKQRATNRQVASQRLVDLIGDQDKAQNLITEKAAQLGLSRDALQVIAEQSPDAFMAYFETKQTNQSPPTGNEGTVNTDAIANANTGAPEGTLANWNEQRKTKGDKWFYSPEVQSQVLADAERLGKEGFMNK